MRTVHRRRSLTGAAAELDVTQSTVSYTLDRLRRAFDDPLFVRQGRGIVPTPRCDRIAGTADHVLAEIEAAASPADFDPARTTAAVTVSVTYLSRITVLPRVVREIRVEAPGLRLELITGFTDASDHLLTGRADIALTPVAITEKGIRGHSVFRDPYACLMDPANPLARGSLTPESFAAASHLIIHYGAAWRPLYHELLEKQGLNVKVSVSTPDPADVQSLLPGTDLVVALPGHIAGAVGQGLYSCPCPVPAVADIHMFWPARLDRSPLNRWLRARIAAAAAALA